MFESTHQGYGDNPYENEFDAFMSDKSKTPYQCSDVYGTYRNTYERGVAEWNRTHPWDKH